MQKLNIPLSKHTRATRRTRRVVWLPVLLFVFGLFFAGRLGSLWFTQATVLSMAPADTDTAIVLQQTTKTQPYLFDYLQGVPLISDRALTIEQILPWSNGEVAIFLQTDGERSVAIRADKADLPTDLLRQYGVSVQDQGPFVLLSRTLLPISGMEGSSQAPFLPSLSKTWFGQMTSTDGLEISLFATNEGVIVQTRHDIQPVADRFLVHEGVNLALSQLSSGISLSDFNGLDQLLPDTEIPMGFSSDSVGVLLSFESPRGTLLVFDDHTPAKEDLLRELQFIGAFSRPLLESVSLPDGSTYDELVVRPDLISVEEFSLLGFVAYRVSIAGDREVIAVSSENQLLLTDSSTLIEQYLSDDLTTRACQGNIGFLEPDGLLDEISLQYYSKHVGLLSSLFSQFSTISFENQKYSTEIRFCL